MAAFRFSLTLQLWPGGGVQRSGQLVVARRMGLVAKGWERKRFYKDVSVYITEEGYGILLDHRKLRTPGREVLKLPTEALAMAVAGEWRSQGSILQPSIMHLTALCNTVQDNPHKSSNESTVETLLSHLSTDTLLYHQSHPEELGAMQTREWEPIVSWFNIRFCTLLQPSLTLEPPPLSRSFLSSFSLYLAQLDGWSLQGFWYSVQSCHSVLLSAALMEDHITVETATDLSRLETRHQPTLTLLQLEGGKIGCWGNVEWQHDMEHQDLLSRLSAAHLLAKLANY